jgi:hypothetical protein
MLTYVGLHELAHVLCDEVGHTAKFYQIFDELLDKAHQMGLYDPSIPIIYFGFGLLMITTSLSYLPYTQIWLFNQAKKSWVGGITNRGKIQLELEFENLIRYIEKTNTNQVNEKRVKKENI